MSPQSDAVSCAWCDDHLEAWIDGALDPIAAIAVEGHVRRCSSCAESVSLARDVVRDLRDLPELEPPPSVLLQVRAATGPRRRHISWARGRTVVAAAAVVLASLSVVLLWRPARTTNADRIEQATIEARYALGVVARAGRAAGRELGNSLNDGLPAHRAAAEIGRVLDRTRPSDPEVLDVHGG